jgi:hypothetical protein
LCWNEGTSKPQSHKQQTKVCKNISINRKEKLKVWDDEIKLAIQQKNLTFKMYLQKLWN